MEPASPELALIDPDLRRDDLVRLAVDPPLFLRLQLERVAPRARRAVVPASQPPLFAAARIRTVEIVPRPREPPPRAAGRPWPRRGAQVVMLAALAAAGYLVVSVAARDRGEGPTLLTASTLVDTAKRAEARTSEARGIVEREILALVIQAPSKWLPPALIDAKTGLATNNLQTVCRSVPRGGYICVVRPAVHRPGEGLYVRYRTGANGRPSLTWSAYRTG